MTDHFLIIHNDKGEEIKFPLTEEEYQSLKDKFPPERCYQCNKKGSIACEACYADKTAKL